LERRAGRYYLRIYITLRAQNVSLEEINIDHQFRLKTRQRSFVLYAPSSQARKEWMHDIALSINGTHEEELRLKSTNKSGPPKTPSESPAGKLTPSPRSAVTETPSPAVKGDAVTTLPEDYYKGDVVKDLTKKSGKSEKGKGESESSDSSSDDESDSSESPKKSQKKSKSNRKSAKLQVGDLLGLGSEITNLNLIGNPNLASPRSTGVPPNNLASPRSANIQAQAPVNPFLVGGTTSPSTNPFLVNSPSSTLSAPPIMPRAPVSGIMSPGGTTVNPFQPNSGMNIVNPFL